MSPRSFFRKNIFGWGLLRGGLSDGGAYLAVAKILPGQMFCSYLRLVSKLKAADILGYVAFEAISKPEYAEKKNKISQKKENQVVTK